jgi:hypothetical protein
MARILPSLSGVMVCTVFSLAAPSVMAADTQSGNSQTQPTRAFAADKPIAVSRYQVPRQFRWPQFRPRQAPVRAAYRPPIRQWPGFRPRPVSYRAPAWPRQAYRVPARGWQAPALSHRMPRAMQRSGPWNAARTPVWRPRVPLQAKTLPKITPRAPMQAYRPAMRMPARPVYAVKSPRQIQRIPVQAYRVPMHAWKAPRQAYRPPVRMPARAMQAMRIPPMQPVSRYQKRVPIAPSRITGVPRNRPLAYTVQPRKPVSG